MEKKKPKGQGLDVPWWFVPVFVMVYPFAAFGDWIRSKTRKDKKGDPHDISGEPDIPGGGRP